MSGCVRQRFGPTKKRRKERLEQTQTFLQQQVTLDEVSKDNEAKTRRLEGEREEFSILALDGDEAICDLKIRLANIAERRRETTEREESQIERAHQRELKTEKLEQGRDLHLAKLNQEKLFHGKD